MPRRVRHQVQTEAVHEQIARGEPILEHEPRRVATWGFLDLAIFYDAGKVASRRSDIDFDGLKDYLTATFVKTQTIRYEIRYRRVTFNENKKIYIEYTYSASFRIPGLKGEEWKHTVADNRLEIVPEGESFKLSRETCTRYSPRSGRSRSAAEAPSITVPAARTTASAACAGPASSQCYRCGRPLL